MEKFMVVETTLRVFVHYVAAAEPFKDEHADRNETVWYLKTRVLNAFDLTEGPTPDGTVVSYALFHHKTPLENPNQTLGELVGEHYELELKLVQQLTQG